MGAPAKCPGCGGRMEEGFIPDITRNAVLPSCWHPGPPEKATFFGLPVGTKIDSKRMQPIRTWRCSSCGLLQSFAHPAQKRV